MLDQILKKLIVVINYILLIDGFNRHLLQVLIVREKQLFFVIIAYLLILLVISVYSTNKDISEK